MGRHSPKSRAYLRARREMFAIYGEVCHLCGHPDAGEADHLVPVSEWPDQQPDPHLMRPAHGTSGPCPTCGRKCNRERGTSAVEEFHTPRIEW